MLWCCSRRGWRVLRCGGNWNNTSNAGAAYFNGNNNSTNTNTNIGVRLLACIYYYCVGFSTPLGENIAIRTPLSKSFMNLKRGGGKQGDINMPKRIGYLYEKMIDKEFIKETILKAANGRKNRKDIKPIIQDLDKYVEKTYKLLKENKYIPSIPKKKEIYDNSSQKYRTITFLPFWPDCIVQWLVVETCKPIFMRGMCYWSCASIPGRGTKRIRKHLQYVLQHDIKGTKYAAEMDIKKYYENIDISLLIKSLERKIKDKKFLKLIEDIVLTCDKGLAIGYYLNQWLANYFLESLDTYIFTLDGVKYMTRHMDNIVILGPNKRKIGRARNSIEKFMNENLHLCMKENWQVYPTSKRMVSAVGYRYSHTHTILRKRNFLRMIRQARRIKKRLDNNKPILFNQAAGLLSRTGQLKHCNSYNVRVKYIDHIKIKKLKNVVRNKMKNKMKGGIQ